MAFEKRNFNNVSSGAGESAGMWSYESNDELSVIAADGYFNQMRFALKENDIILLQGLDGSNILIVTSLVNDSDVTTSNFSLSGGGAAVTQTEVTNQFGPIIDGTSRYIQPPGVELPSTTATYTMDRIHYLPIISPRSQEYAHIGCRVSVVGGTGTGVRMGLYDLDQFGAPNNLVVDAGIGATTSTGNVELNITEDLFGRYYIAFLHGTSDSATEATFQERDVLIQSTFGAETLVYNANATTGFYETVASSIYTNGLPATAGGSYTNLTSVCPVVWIRTA